MVISFLQYQWNNYVSDKNVRSSQRSENLKSENQYPKSKDDPNNDIASDTSHAFDFFWFFIFRRFSTRRTTFVVVYIEYRIYIEHVAYLITCAHHISFCVYLAHNLAQPQNQRKRRNTQRESV